MTDNERPEGAPPEGQPHLGQTPAPGDSGETETIEFPGFIPPEGAEPEPAEQPQQPEQRIEPKPKRPRSDPQRRIDQLTAKNAEIETTAQRLFRETQELREQLGKRDATTAEEKARAERAEHAALLHHKSDTDARIDLAVGKLKAAKEGGDIAAEIAATQELTALQAKKNDIANWEAAHPAPKAPAAAEPAREEPRQEQRQQAQPQQPQQPQVAPAAAAWIEKTGWFNPQSEEFDREKHLATASFAYALEQRLIKQGRQAEINTPGYFKQLERFAASAFPEDAGDGGEEGVGAETDDDGSTFTIPALSAPTELRRPTGIRNGRPVFNEQQGNRMPTMSNDSTVTPVNSGQQAPSRNGGQKNARVDLSTDEKQLARGSWEAGAMGNHWRTGKPVANAREAEEQWAFRKLPAEAQARARQAAQSGRR